jgi:hypothetical protein
MFFPSRASLAADLPPATPSAFFSLPHSIRIFSKSPLEKQQRSGI